MNPEPVPGSAWEEGKIPQPSTVAPPVPGSQPAFPTDPITWLRGALRIIGERIVDPSPEHPAEECLRFARDLARAALRQSPTGELRLGDFHIDPEQVEEAMVDYERGDYQTVEEILLELQSHHPFSIRHVVF